MKKKKIIILIFMITFFIILGLFVYKTNHDNYQYQLDYYYKLVDLYEANKITEEPIKPIIPSATELYGTIIRNNVIFLSSWIIPIIIVLFSTFSFYKVLSSGFIKNISSRSLYTKYIKKSVLKSWLKAIMVFVIPHLYIFIICLLYSNFRIYGEPNSYFAEAFNGNVILSLSIIFYFSLFAIFCCNLGLILIKKRRKFIIDILLVEIIYVILALFMELGIGTIFDNLASQYNYLLIYSSKITFLSIFNIFPYYYINILGSHWVTILIMVLLVILTTGIVYLRYSNKESVMIECEN